MSSETDHNLTIELKAHGFELPAAEYSMIEDCVDPLREALDCFPLKSLAITIDHNRKTHDYHVKTSLRLSRRTLFTGERNRTVHSAIERCIDKLLHKIKGLKLHFSSEAEISKQSSGTHHTVESTLEFNTKELEDACFYQDYVRFRRGLGGFETALTERVGRWIQRYPEIEDQLAGTITISDIVEDVYFHAFEQFSQRNQEVPPGVWLEDLIDPTIQDLLHYPEAEFANICYAQHRLKNSRS